MIEVPGYDGRLLEMDSSHVSRLVMGIRHASLQQSSYLVRKAVEEIGKVMAYEVEQRETALGYFGEARRIAVTTGNGGARAVHDVRAVEPVLLNILRAANDMVHGAREVFQEAPVIFADTKRVGETYSRSGDHAGEMQIDLNYMSAPKRQFDDRPFHLSGRVLVVPDPMGATFFSVEKAVAHASERYGNPSRQVFMNVITAKPGVDNFLERMKKKGLDCCVYTAALDPELDGRAFIVPGAGDLGDLQHNGGRSLVNIMLGRFFSQ